MKEHCELCKAIEIMNVDYVEYLSEGRVYRQPVYCPSHPNERDAERADATKRSVSK